jgi:hypothetical protein
MNAMEIFVVVLSILLVILIVVSIILFVLLVRVTLQIRHVTVKAEQAASGVDDKKQIATKRKEQEQ